MILRALRKKIKIKNFSDFIIKLRFQTGASVSRLSFGVKIETIFQQKFDLFRKRRSIFKSKLHFEIDMFDFIFSFTRGIKAKVIFKFKTEVRNGS